MKKKFLYPSYILSMAISGISTGIILGHIPFHWATAENPILFAVALTLIAPALLLVVYLFKKVNNL